MDLHILWIHVIYIESKRVQVRIGMLYLHRIWEALTRYTYDNGSTGYFIFIEFKSINAISSAFYRLRTAKVFGYFLRGPRRRRDKDVATHFTY